VLPNYLNHSAKNIAEAVSHEVGHTLGLLHSGTIEHDGVTAVGYYDGGAYGDLKTSWVPIMGVPYYKNVSQFTKGDYKYADKQVDQFAVINSKGVDYVKDLAGDTLIDAALLSYKGNVNGIIGVNDVDYYSISVTHSAINIKIDTAKVGGNLDAKVTLLASDGSKVVSDNVKDELNAMIKIKVPNGNYFVRVEGVGRTGINGDEGYSSYGSVGRYTISYQ
jgi:serralysin